MNLMWNYCRATALNCTITATLQMDPWNIQEVSSRGSRGYHLQLESGCILPERHRISWEFPKKMTSPPDSLVTNWKSLEEPGTCEGPGENPTVRQLLWLAFQLLNLHSAANVTLKKLCPGTLRTIDEGKLDEFMTIVHIHSIKFTLDSLSVLGTVQLCV